MFRNRNTGEIAEVLRGNRWAASMVYDISSVASEM